MVLYVNYATQAVKHAQTISQQAAFHARTTHTILTHQTYAQFALVRAKHAAAQQLVYHALMDIIYRL